MPKLPRIKSSRVLSALLRAGFYVHHQTGSHVNLRHPDKTYLHIVVPKHNKDLAPKTLKTIISQVGLSVEEFKKLL